MDVYWVSYCYAIHSDGIAHSSYYACPPLVKDL
jgi:hypothetical protein